MDRARTALTPEGTLEVEASSPALDTRTALAEAFATLRAASAREVVARLGRDQGYRIEDLVALEAHNVPSSDLPIAREWLRRRLPSGATIVCHETAEPAEPVTLFATLAPRAEERTRAYSVEEGRIDVESVELHVVEQCNLRCAQCCNVSPYLADGDRALSSEEVSAACARIREVMRPSVLKIMGGEPLLHPDLPGVLRAVRESGVAPRIRLFTNGLLLRSLDDATFALLDELTVSSYASAPVKPEIVAETEARARRFDVVLNVKEVVSFTTVLTDRPNDDAAMQEAYDSCWLRHRCLVVRDGVFYKCTRAAYHADFHAKVALEGAHDVDAEATQRAIGIPLSDPDFAKRAAAYLSAREPIASCRHCLGSAGPLTPHVQLRRRDVAAGRLVLA